MTCRAINGVSGPAIGNSTLNLRVGTTMANVAIQAAVTMFCSYIGCVAVSTVRSGKKGLIMCKGMINLTMAINTVY
jgi:hypothetical protein